MYNLSKKFQIAIEGCFHGCCDDIFGTIEHIQKVKGIQIDLLLVCGDFQAMRNTYDMNTMACPPKYLNMGTFYKYYTGEKVAPCLTIVIGGNHEASSHLRELYFGGWLAPRIYFLGHSGCITVKKGDISLRIGGISGIYSQPSFNNSRMDYYPFDDRGKYSVYHQKQIDILKWLLYSQQKVDIFMSHDWPQGIYHHGNKKELLQKKKHFFKDIANNQLGSPPLKWLLNHIQPKYWFSAHMHVKFTALYKHKESNKETQYIIFLDFRFLALDKCQPGREFLQLLHMTAEGINDQNLLRSVKDELEVKLYHDEEWLAIVKSTYKFLTIWDKMPKFFIWNEGFKVYQHSKTDKFEELKTETAVELQMFTEIEVADNFAITVQPYEGNRSNINEEEFQEIPINNQTKDFLKLIRETGIELNHFVYVDPRQKRAEMQEFQQLFQQKSQQGDPQKQQQTETWKSQGRQQEHSSVNQENGQEVRKNYSLEPSEDEEIIQEEKKNTQFNIQEEELPFL